MSRFLGMIIGLATLVIIGAFHPIVIKFEFHLGKRLWPLFLVAGGAFLAGSALVADHTVSAVLGILGFTCFWSIRELFEQEQRVKQGRFPKNPRRQR